MVDPEQSQAAKQAAYYQRRARELAAENIRLQFASSIVRIQLEQKARAIALLSSLWSRVGAYTDIEAIFKGLVEEIDATLAMDRTVLLRRDGETFRPAYWSGYAADEVDALRIAQLEVPAELLGEGAGLLVRGGIEVTPFIAAARSALKLDYFVCAPLAVDADRVGLLFTGRNRELPPTIVALDQGDLDSLRSITTLVSTSVKNVRLALLEELDATKSEFFANVSHEFRTPLTLSIGLIDGALAGRYGLAEDGVLEQLRTVRANQGRLLALINDILALSKLDAGRLELHAHRLPSFNEYVRQRVALFAPSIRQRGLECRMRLDPALEHTPIYLDAERFDGVIVNLLGNALKFTDQGHIEIATELLGGEVPAAALAVADTGTGIAADQLELIFDRFRQAAGSGVRGHVGTGIGLAFARELVRMHGGTLTAVSQPGVGSVFRATVPLGREHLPPGLRLSDEPWDPGLPAARATDMEIETGTVRRNAPAVPQHLDARRETVLYVDDNAELRNYVHSLLEPEFNVLLAGHGKQALELLDSHGPSLVLSDLMMPEMNGLELCAAIRARPELQGLPFLLLTARGEVETKIESLEHGVDDYLSKPFLEAELLARVRNLLSLRRHQLRLKRELVAARAVQRALLPPPTLRIGPLFVQSLYVPSEELSGDCFDVVDSGERVYVYVADVTSHGVASAQVAYVLRSIFREAIERRSKGSLWSVWETVRAAYRSYGLAHDAAVQVLRLDKATLEVQALRCNAGMMLLVRNGAASVVDCPITASLATEEPAPPERSTAFTLQAGDQLHLYTDGCYEFPTARRSQLGLRRLSALLEAHPQPEWADPLLERLQAERGPGPFPDDLTILRITVCEPMERLAGGRSS